MKYFIKWQKWRDPFGGDLEENEMPLIDSDDIEDNDDDDDDDEYGEGVATDKFQKGFNNLIKNKSIQVISTPMGIVPINEYSQPGKLFKFWTGHTSFNITEGVVEIIDKIDGVESLDVFSRYRMRVGVGFAFSDGEILRNIDSAISLYHNAKTDASL